MPLLLENAHAVALLNCVMNLVKEAVEHLNPNLTPVLTMDQPLSAIAKEIQWLWPDSFSNNKYVIMTGGGGGRGGVFMLIWSGECLNGSGWPNAITTAGTVLQNLLWRHLILQGKDMPTLLQLQCYIFCSRLPSFFTCSLSPIMLSAPNSDKHRMEIEQQQFKYWALVLDFSSVSFGLCVEFVVVTTIREMSD